MSVPAISVLMPVYNCAKYLGEAIESVLSQSFTDFEFIIINDGSTDSSLEIINSYVKSDSRIKVISRENFGLIQTLNEGINMCQGKYISRMDADDICLPTRFEKQYDFLEANPDYIVVGSKVQIIDIDGDKLCHMVDIFEHDAIDSAHIKNLTSGAVIVHPASMIQRKSLMDIGGYHEKYKYAEDIDVWLRLAEIGKLYNLKEILLSYRQHFESIGYSHRQGQLRSIEKAIEDACLRRGIENTVLGKAKANTYIIKAEWEVYVKWGWWAISDKNIRTAKKYAIKALAHKPLSMQAWKLLACSIRGY